MAYRYVDMDKLDWRDVVELHERGELVGCYKLYPDNTEALIEEDYDFNELIRHYEAGGEFGFEKGGTKDV